MSLGKRKSSIDHNDHNDPDTAEKRRRDFERSLAGPSVGKAGLQRDQTGEQTHCESTPVGRDQPHHRRRIKGELGSDRIN